MSEEAILYGCIEGAWNWRDFTLYIKNEEAIHALPELDQWPPLNRSMFGVPMKQVGSEAAFYRTQVIPFGTSMKNFDVDIDWAPWQEKFEKLLRQMYWYKAHLHLYTEVQGEYECLWQVHDREIFQGFFLEDPPPVSKWSFKENRR